MNDVSLTFDSEGYTHVLRTALARGYWTGPLCEARAAPGPALVLRHDVDFSLERAVAMAELEAALGVRSTYLVMTTSPFYNPFAPRSREILKRFIELGHEVGLHWDSSSYPADSERAVAQFRTERDLMGAAAGAPVRTASQHIPTHTPLFDVSAHVELEAYSRALVDRYRYVSDSSMLWRETTPLELIQSGIDVYFLSHPIWWMSPGKSQNEKLQFASEELQECIAGEMEGQKDYLKVLIAGRAKADPAFLKRMGWSPQGGGAQ